MAKFLIAGEQRDSESKQTTEVRNPATAEVVDAVPKGTIHDIRRAIDVAAGALKKWSQMAPSKRGAILLQAGHLILQQEKELATLLTREQGKPLATHYAHLTVHGVLHLLGWDHENDRDAERMEQRERQILATLGIGDPYLET